MRASLVASIVALLAACATQHAGPSTAPDLVPVDAGLSLPADAGSPTLVPDAGAPPAPAPTTAGQPITARKLWRLKLEGVGTSSPRAADLTGDGVLDVVVGGGVQGRAGWTYVIDGATGKLVWKARFKEEFYATPTLSDATGDGVPDVFMGGRDFEWTALDGKTGKKLWSLRKANPKADIPKRNFNGALVVGDQDGDGIDDLLVSQGGSYDDTRRLPGRLFVVSAAAGKLLVNTTFPDQLETYCLPALLSPSPLTVVAGSGGETIPGHLTRLTFEPSSALAAWSVPSGKMGVVSSPLLTRVGADDAVIISFYDGRVARLDPGTGALRWETPRPGFESRASAAPGRFGGSSTTDVVATMSKGTFPEYRWENVVVWYDGATGAVLDTAGAGVFSSASPLVADFDGDGLDETLTLSMNAFTIEEGTVISTLTIYDGSRGKPVRLALRLKGAGGATPAVADLDGDGTLDLLLAYYGVVERYALELPGGPVPTVRWGQFRGPSFNGQDTRAPGSRR